MYVILHEIPLVGGPEEGTAYGRASDDVSPHVLGPSAEEREMKGECRAAHSEAAPLQARQNSLLAVRHVLARVVTEGISTRTESGVCPITVDPVVGAICNLRVGQVEIPPVERGV